MCIVGSGISLITLGVWILGLRTNKNMRVLLFTRNVFFSFFGFLSVGMGQSLRLRASVSFLQGAFTKCCYIGVFVFTRSSVSKCSLNRSQQLIADGQTRSLILIEDSSWHYPTGLYVCLFVFSPPIPSSSHRFNELGPLSST